MDPTQYYVVLGLNLLAGLLWVAAALAAFSGWRAFRQRADLAWIGAFICLALAGFGNAAGAWRAMATSETLSGPAIVYAETVLPDETRAGALLLIASLLAFYAFVQRRSL
jgi:hypothetical protein